MPPVYESQIMSDKKNDKKNKNRKSVAIDTDDAGFLGLGPYDEMQNGADEYQDTEVFNFSEAG